jgi:hypothetical protein
MIEINECYRMLCQISEHREYNKADGIAYD